MKQLSLTIDVEEWYHSLWFDSERVVEKYFRGEFPFGGFIKPLEEILSLFNQHKVTTTFFVLGEITERFPEIVEKISDEGHEVASHSSSHVDITMLDATLFESSEKKNMDRLWKLQGEKPLGFRAPNFRMNTKTVNALERIGYLYDSSSVPSIRIPGWYGGRGPMRPYKPSTKDFQVSARIEENREFYEVPISVLPVIRLPSGGGWFLRNIGLGYVKCVVKILVKKEIPAILYIHPWEASGNNPRLEEIPFHVFRRTGKYVLNSIRTLLKDIDAKKVPVRDIVRSI